MKHLEKQKDEIIADYKKGLSYDKLAAHYGCARNTIIKHLKEWDVFVSKKPPHISAFEIEA